MRTVMVFDPVIQQEVLHESSFAANGELVLQSTGMHDVEEDGKLVSRPTGHFVKIDTRGMSKEQFDDFLAEYKNVNEGKVTLEQVQSEQKEILDTLLGEDPEQDQSNDSDQDPT